MSTRAPWRPRHSLCSLAIGRLGLQRQMSPTSALSPSSAFQAAGQVTGLGQPTGHCVCGLSAPAPWAHLCPRLLGPGHMPHKIPSDCLAMVSFPPRDHSGKLQGLCGVDYIAIPIEGQRDSSHVLSQYTQHCDHHHTPGVFLRMR